jgi:hypothetical protein
MKNIKFVLIFVLVFAMTMSVWGAEVSRELTRNTKNTESQRINGFDFEAWTDHRGADAIEMSIYQDGSFSGRWTQTYNTLFRVGRRFPRNTRINSLGDISLSYNAPEFTSSRGATYMGVYGWTRDSLIEWYITESWLEWNVMQILGEDNVVHHGTVEANGNTYDIVTNWRINQPSIEGQAMTTFLQIFSIRQGSRRNRVSTDPLNGTIDISAHFNAWEKMIPTQTLTAGGRTHTSSFSTTSELHEIMFVIEGFGGEPLSNGHGKVDALCIRYGDNRVCTANGCANCTGATTPSPTPQPTPEPTPSPSPTPEPTSSPSPTATHVMRFQVNSITFTERGVTKTLDAAPFIDPVHGRTMVPLRAAAEGLGATIDWNNATQTITLVRNGTTAVLTIGIDLPDGMGTAELVSGRTFVPVRYVSEILGAEVRWESATRAVYIYQ